MRSLLSHLHEQKKVSVTGEGDAGTLRTTVLHLVKKNVVPRSSESSGVEFQEFLLEKLFQIDSLRQYQY